MKLYYLSATEDPVIAFNKDEKRIADMLDEFSGVVRKIENNDYSTRKKDTFICKYCDMKYYCGKSNTKK